MQEKREFANSNEKIDCYLSKSKDSSFACTSGRCGERSWRRVLKGQCYSSRQYVKIRIHSLISASIRVSLYFIPSTWMVGWFCCWIALYWSFIAFRTINSPHEEPSPGTSKLPESQLSHLTSHQVPFAMTICNLIQAEQSPWTWVVTRSSSHTPLLPASPGLSASPAPAMTAAS